jgi:hypothetical protein
LIKKSESFAITGLVAGDEKRKHIVQSLIRTYFDLKYPIRIGNLETGNISMTAVKTTGIFEFNTSQVANQCVIDIDMKLGVLAITFKGGKDRMFVVPSKGAKPEIKMKNGRICIQFTLIRAKFPQSPVIYAQRSSVAFVVLRFI